VNFTEFPRFLVILNTRLDPIECGDETARESRVRVTWDGRLHVAVLSYRVCAVSFHSAVEADVG
jgi:hypothetical protein